jgi:hypothetical protein
VLRSQNCQLDWVVIPMVGTSTLVVASAESSMPRNFCQAVYPTTLTLVSCFGALPPKPRGGSLLKLPVPLGSSLTGDGV